MLAIIESVVKFDVIFRGCVSGCWYNNYYCKPEYYVQIAVQINVAKEITNYWNESSWNNENKMDMFKVERSQLLS